MCISPYRKAEVQNMTNLTKEEISYLIALLQAQEDTQIAVRARNGEINLLIAKKLQNEKK